jgi:hypothetical protein
VCSKTESAALLLRERLDDVHPDDALLGDRRDVGDPLLHLTENGMRDAAVAIRREDDGGGDRERDEREPPVVDEENGRHDDDRHDVLGEEDQPIPEEEAHRLEVGRRPRHELPRLAAVVEAERQAQQMRVDVVADVVLHRERLPARDESAAEHERAANEPQRDDRGDPEPEDLAVAVALELVDEESGEDRHEDPGDL